MYSVSKNKKILRLIDIVDQGLCTGCGFCSVVCPCQCVDMIWTETRTWAPKIDAKKCVPCGQCMAVCPNTPECLFINGQQVSEKTSQDRSKVTDNNVYYSAYATSEVSRTQSASGGVSTALLQWLLESRKVEAVIAVKPSDGLIGSRHFEAVVCRSINELEVCRSSAYGPICYDRVFAELSASNEKFAISTLPCTMRAINNLPERWRKRVLYTVGLMCSHNVTDQLGDFMAYRHCVGQKDLYRINYRDKTDIPNSHEYNTRLSYKSGREICTPRMHNGFTVAWRGYWFAQECCLYCPDFCGNNADISVKDAWGRLSNDPRGFSLCIIRNPELTDIFDSMRNAGWIQYMHSDFNEVFLSHPDAFKLKHVDVWSRWSQKDILRPILFQMMPGFKPDPNVLVDHARFMRNIKWTKRMFRGSTRRGYYTILALNRLGFWDKGKIQKMAGHLPQKLKRVLRKLINGVKRSLRRAASGPPIFMKMADSGSRRRILIAGGYGYGNTGDEAQLGANLTRWGEIAPDAEVIVLSPDPEYTAKNHDIESTYASRVVFFDANKRPDYGRSTTRFRLNFWTSAWRLLTAAWCLRRGLPLITVNLREAEFLRLLCSAAMMHLSGGGFLTGMTRSRLWDHMLLLQLCKRLGVSSILTGHTIGVFQTRADRWLARWGLSCAEQITVRDRDESRFAMAEIGIEGEHIKERFDDALFCDQADRETVEKALIASGINPSLPYAAVNFHYWGQSRDLSHRLVKRFAELCDNMHEDHKLQIVFVPMVKPDENAIADCMRQMTPPACQLCYDYDYRVVRGVIGGAEICLAMKHHPIVFAMGNGVPAIGVAVDDYYTHKNRGALSLFGMEKWLLSNDAVFSKTAEEMIAQLITRRAELSAEINDSLARYREQDGDVLKSFLN